MKTANRSLCLSMLFILLFGTSAMADMVAIVSRKSAVVRQSPDKKGKIILTVKRGYRFAVSGQRGNPGWRRVYDPKKKISGWILAGDVHVIIEDRFWEFDTLTGH